ncbi:MAG: hypothetical protein JWL97_4512 [Gemmatimonadales bacterium]|nr:hypothetical protein [Gemmatimonadales bacterium]
MSPTLSDVEPVPGSDVREGDVIVNQYGVLAAPITHFDLIPSDSVLAAIFGPGTRVAYNGSNALRTIAPDDLIEVIRPCPDVSPAELNEGDRIILDDEVTVISVEFNGTGWTIVHNDGKDDLGAFDFVERTFNAEQGA